MLPQNLNISKEDVKRRKSAQINSFPSINMLYNNLNTSYKSTSDLAKAQPVIKSNSLFAYQELDEFSSFCDDSINSAFLSDKNAKIPFNNINNNNSTKVEECDQSGSMDESFDNNMSEDEIIMKKNKPKKDKRKSAAFNCLPSYLKNIAFMNKPNEPQCNNNLSNSDKKMNKNSIKNIYNNGPNNFILNNNNNNGLFNTKRNSFSNNQFRNDLIYNNILNLNNNKFIFPTQNTIENNSINITNDNKNNFIKNNNINTNQNINFIPNIQNTNSPFNNTNPNNFQNYNMITNFPPYNSYYNNNSPQNIINNNNIINPNINTKKRNSLSLFSQHQACQIINQRRSSHPSVSNLPIPDTEKQIEKNKINEENPAYFLRDQLYCRQIQTKLENNINNKQYSEEFYQNIKPFLIEIIEHQFGNYVIQKFLDVLILQENKIIFKNIFVDIKEKLFSICIHNYGTRVIQKSLEKLENGKYSKIETDELNLVFQYLIENHLYELCCDKNGNHVYQKLLRIFPKENNKNNFLFDSLIKISYQVSIIQQGATLLGVAFDNSNETQKEKLCDAIIEKIGDLIIDKYGNYTIQTVFKLYNEKVNEKLFKYIDDNIFRLSKEKFSSNVIDKCILENSEKSHKLIDNMIKKNIIKDMIVDKFGNYVVQKAMSISDRNTCEKIAEQIKPKLGELQKTNIGKKVYEKLMQNYKDLLE